MEASALRAPAGLGRGSGTSPWLRLRSDEQLVGLFRSGNEEAFRVIHDRYRARLYAYARQMLGGSGSDAEDVMQDVFLRAYRALRLDERPVSLRAWLYRVAHNRCIDHVRRPTPAPAEIFEMSRTPVVDPLAAAERREDLQRLIADVRRLPEQQRSALLMREMVGMSYADLATALDTSVPAVKSLLVRARIGLVEAIEARDADCADIRLDLAASYDKGVRASGRARRHLRECTQCTTYREQLRGVKTGFAALNPSVAAPGLVAKLLGLGGAGSGAAAGAGGAGTAATVGGAAAVTIPKVAAIVCCAAVMGGGAIEVQKVVDPSPGPSKDKPKRAAAAAAAESAAPATAVATAAAAVLVRQLHDATPSFNYRRDKHRVTETEDLAMHPSTPMMVSFASTKEGRNGSGGAVAPDEETTTYTVTDDGTDEDVATTPTDEPTIGDIVGISNPQSSSTQGGPTQGGSSSSTSSSSGSGSGTSTSGSGTSGSSTSGSSTSGSSTSGSSTSGSSDPSASTASTSPSSSSSTSGSSTGSGSSSSSGSTGSSSGSGIGPTH